MENTTSLIPTISEQFDNSLELFKGGGEILTANNILADKIIQSGHNILGRIEQNGGKLNPELDKLCNDYIAKARQRKSEMETSRKPVTQMLTAVQKLFTGIENKLDNSKPETVLYKIQEFRNKYAKELAEIQRAKEAKAAAEARKAQILIDFKSNCERAIILHFNDYCLEQKRKYQNSFNSLTLEDIDERGEKLKSINPVYPYTHFQEFKRDNLRVPSVLSEDEVSNAILNVTTDKFEGFAEQFKNEVGEFLNSLIARIPSKKAELISLKEADEEEKKRIAEERAKREQAEAERLANEAQKQKEEAEHAINMKKVEEETMVLFEKEAAVSIDEPLPETRNALEIKVSHAAGYVQIFSFWFENEGKNLSLDKIEKKSLKQMKTFCEKHASNSGELIESKFLTYEPVYTAVNRK